jgi:hypothetical protein
MLSALDNKQHDPHDVLEISPDVVLVARAAADFPSLAPDGSARDVHMGAADAATPRVDTTFRATDTSGERSSGGKLLRRSAIAFLFALASAFGAAAWERYGGEAQAMLSDFSPQVTLASLLPTSLPSWLTPGKAAKAAQPDDTAPQAQAAAADQAAQPAAPQATDSAAPAAAAVPADTAQLIQSMARDVASLNQQLGELKARIAELKAGQEQLGRDMASKASEARAAEPRISEAKPVEPRPTKLGAPPRPLGTLVTAPVHRPRPPSYPPAQAAYVPPPPVSAAPVQIAPAPPPATVQPDGDPVVRPPMPVR